MASSLQPSKRQLEVVSPSLLNSIKIHPVPRRFSLGMDEFVGPEYFTEDPEDSTAPSAKKRKSLSLKKPGKENSNPAARFDDAFAAASDDQYDQLAKGFVPKNTGKCTNWALNNFSEWCRQRNARFPDQDQCPEDLITETPYDNAKLCHWLCRFVAETRQKNGAKYPATTLYQLLCGLNRFMHSVDPRAPNLVDIKNPDFHQLHSTMDSVFHSLRMEGVSVQVKHAPIITKEEENLLWSQGILNLSTPLCLLRAVFYSNGKIFCLQGGKEHRGLKLSQFVRLSNPDRYVYTENGSKNRSGGFTDLRVENKVVPILANGDAGIRCHVKQLDVYFSKLPAQARELDAFYLRPLTNAPDDPTKSWFATVPVGENKLGAMVKDMFGEVGISGKTNHSLRATGATSLYTANVPEKMIQQRTGHRSLKALRIYERTTQDQELAVSKILTSDSKIDYAEATSKPAAESEATAPSSSLGVVPAKQCDLPSNAPSHMLNQLCQVSKSQSFAPSLSTLFGSTTNCVINVNFGQSSTSVEFHGKEEFEYELPEGMERAMSSLDF